MKRNYIATILPIPRVRLKVLETTFFEFDQDVLGLLERGLLSPNPYRIALWPTVCHCSKTGNEGKKWNNATVTPLEIPWGHKKLLLPRLFSWGKCFWLWKYIEFVWTCIDILFFKQPRLEPAACIVITSWPKENAEKKVQKRKFHLFLKRLLSVDLSCWLKWFVFGDCFPENVWNLSETLKNSQESSVEKMKKHISTVEHVFQDKLFASFEKSCLQFQVKTKTISHHFLISCDHLCDINFKNRTAKQFAFKFPTFKFPAFKFPTSKNNFQCWFRNWYRNEGTWGKKRSWQAVWLDSPSICLMGSTQFNALSQSLSWTSSWPYPLPLPSCFSSCSPCSHLWSPQQ